MQRSADKLKSEHSSARLLGDRQICDVPLPHHCGKEWLLPDAPNTACDNDVSWSDPHMNHGEAYKVQDENDDLGSTIKSGSSNVAVNSLVRQSA